MGGGGPCGGDSWPHWGPVFLPGAERVCAGQVVPPDGAGSVGDAPCRVPCPASGFVPECRECLPASAFTTSSLPSPCEIPSAPRVAPQGQQASVTLLFAGPPARG